MRNIRNRANRFLSTLLVFGILFSCFTLFGDIQEINAQSQLSNPLTLNSDLVLGWHTFFGSGERITYVSEAAADQNGNVYVIGDSGAGWGNPVRAYSGGDDSYIVKLNSAGDLVWLTFLGSGFDDEGQGISIDSDGNVFVVGTSNGSWGDPINSFNGMSDAFVAKLNGESGVLQWNTFMGGFNQLDDGSDLTLDNTGNIFVVGRSKASWGDPVHSHVGDYDAFVAKLNKDGAFLWNTFLGSVNEDRCTGVALDANGFIYVAGQSETTWGNPVNAHSGGEFDAFVAKLSSQGSLQWNTFQYSIKYNHTVDIAAHPSGRIYLAGSSHTSWGNPIRPYAAGYDPYVVELNSSGVEQWNTFLGSASSSNEYIRQIVLDQSGNIYWAGTAEGEWGNPSEPYHGGADAVSAKLSPNGDLLWNTFIGTSEDSEDGWGIAVDKNENLYVAGTSWGDGWGDPVNDHSGYVDGFVVKFDSTSTEKKLFLPILLR